ncbi:MAG: hypothetical protein R3F20_04020 [Planctomycetota bacterium]
MALGANLNLGYNLANRDLLRSTVNWLLGRERMITKTPRVYTRHLARLEEDDLKTFSALTIWILPALSSSPASGLPRETPSMKSRNLVGVMLLLVAAAAARSTSRRARTRVTPARVLQDVDFLAVLHLGPSRRAAELDDAAHRGRRLARFAAALRRVDSRRPRGRSD